MNQLHYHNFLRRGLWMLIPVITAGCSDFTGDFRQDTDDGSLRLEFTASISQDNTTRADESGFADGDRFGVYVVNYSQGQPGSLSESDNQVNNVAVSYSVSENSWTPASDIYWLDNSTKADVFGYYPFDNGIRDVEAYRFEVCMDQRTVPSSGDMGNYEASDLLWAKTTGAQPGQKVSLIFNHIMAGVKVVLQQGAGFDGDAWSKLTKTITVDNTVRKADVNMSTGVVTATGDFDHNIIMNPEPGDVWRAVVVPQTVAAGSSLIGITIDGKSYSHKLSDVMTYISGKLYTMTIKVDRNSDTGEFEFTLVNSTITPWVADQSSHDFEANTYVVVNVSEAGKLKESLVAMNCDLSSLKNLKVKGNLTDEDFRVMREEMPQLASLHIGEAKMVHIAYREEIEGVNQWDLPILYMDDMIPENALRGKESLRRIVLPEGIVRIGESAFNDLRLTSTLVLPESLKRIDVGAFGGVGEETTIIMPSSLEYIGDMAFYGMAATMDLKLSNTIKYIGAKAFYHATGAIGTFNLPTKLEYLGEAAFEECGGQLAGDIVIPATLKEIPASSLRAGFANGTTLTIPEGVTRICDSAFAGLKFLSPVRIPSSVKFIDKAAFKYCRFKGGISLPKEIAFVASEAFQYSDFSGEVEFPSVQNVTNNPFQGTQIESIILGDNILQISNNAFDGCAEIRKIQIGKNVEFIGENAFAVWGALNTVICLAPAPPVIKGSAFSGFQTDRVILEVPEGSVEAYRNAAGWNVFKNITPHHELAFNIPDIVCLDKGMTREGVVRAEGAWSVVECPDWVHVTPDHSDYKDNVTVTVDPMPAGAASREAQIVFKLNEKDYTTSTSVRQLSYEKAEDTEITLQTATKGNKEIPVFIVGEGFNADNIVSGNYLKLMEETMEQFFAIEPYKSYRDYFTVTTAIACSPEDGTGDLYTVKENCFDTDQVSPDTHKLRSYVERVSNHAGKNMGNALIIMVSNHDSFSGWSQIDYDGCSLASFGLTEDVYPYDQRGLVQRFAGGEAFAGLGNESVSHFEHIKGCTCPGCKDMGKYDDMKSRGYYVNLSMSSKMADAPWSDFIFHPKYSQMVDMWEGGYNHLRGVWRSEANSVMNQYISYFNTISRYAIYKEIMRRSGGVASLDDFIANDKIELAQ